MSALTAGLNADQAAALADRLTEAVRFLPRTPDVTGDQDDQTTQLLPPG